jgi:hypothetical protein
LKGENYSAVLRANINRGVFMKKTYVLILVLFCSVLFGQKANPLFQVINNSTLINRTEDLRKLQTTLSDNLNELRPGLNIQIAEPYIQQAKEIIRKAITGIELKIKPIPPAAMPTVITLELYFSDKKLIDVTLTNTDKNFGEMLDNLEFSITNEFKQQIMQINCSDDIKALVLNGLCLMIQKLEVGADVQLGNDPVLIAESIAKMLSSKLKTELFTLLKEKFNINEKMLGSLNLVSVCKELIEKLNKEKEYLVQLLNKGEYSLNKLVSDANDVLFNGNVGFALTKGEGNFAGGLNLLFKLEDDIQIGTYVNTQFNSSADQSINNNVGSLFGLQARWAFASTKQLDLLVTGLFRNEIPAAMEVGLGYSFKPTTYKDFIFGIAFFYAKKYNSESGLKEDTQTIGFTLKSANTSIPNLVLGVVGINWGGWVPLVQLSYPISSK